MKMLIGICGKERKLSIMKLNNNYIKLGAVQLKSKSSVFTSFDLWYRRIYFLKIPVNIFVS